MMLTAHRVDRSRRQSLVSPLGPAAGVQRPASFRTPSAPSESDIDTARGVRERASADVAPSAYRALAGDFGPLLVCLLSAALVIMVAAWHLRWKASTVLARVCLAVGLVLMLQAAWQPTAQAVDDTERAAPSGNAGVSHAAGVTNAASRRHGKLAQFHHSTVPAEAVKAKENIAPPLRTDLARSRSRSVATKSEQRQARLKTRIPQAGRGQL